MAVTLADAFIRIRTDLTGVRGELIKGTETAATEAGVLAGKAFGGTMSKNMVLGSVAITAGVGAIFASAVKSAGNFEASMVKLTSTAGETGTMVRGNLKTVSDGILTLAGSTGTTTKQLSDGMYTVESAGFHGAAGLTVLKAAAQGARAEQANLATVTNAVTSAMISYHLPADQATTITNQMIVATSRGKLTFEQLAGSLSTVLPLASSIGLSFAEVTGAEATMTAHGESADLATQHLAFTMRGILAPNVQAQKEMQRMGLSAVDLSQHLGERGLTGTLKIMSDAVTAHMGPAGLVLTTTMQQSAQATADTKRMFDALPPAVRAVAKQFLDGSISAGDWRAAVKGMPADQANLARQFATSANASRGFNDLLKAGGPEARTYQDIIKRMTGGVDGLQTTLMLTGENLSAFTSNVKAVAEAGKHAGKDIEGWGTIQQTFNFKMSELRGHLEATKIALGEGLLPIVGKMATAVSSVVGPLSLWVASNKDLSGVLLALVGSMGALVIVGYSVAKMLEVAKVAMVALRLNMLAMMLISWVQLLASVRSFRDLWAAITLIMDANPLGLIIIGLAAVAGAIYLAWTHSAAFRVAMIDTWHAIETAFKGIATAATWLWNVILRPAFLAIRATVLDVVAPVFMWLWKNIIGPAFQGARLEISIAWAIIKVIFAIIVVEVKILAAIFMWLWKNVITPVWQGIEIAISIAWALIQVVFGLMEIGVKLVIWWFQGLWTAAKQVWGGIRDAIALAWIAIKPYWDTMVSLIRTFLIPAFQLFGDKVREIWNGAKDTILAIWTVFIKPLFQAFGNIIKDDVVPSFKAGVASIQSAWNGLVEVTKAPIRFVVNTVLEDGLLGAYRWIASKFGVDSNVHVGLPAGFAGGGRIPGTPSNADNMLAMVATGEHIMPTGRTARWLPVLESIRLHDRLPMFPGDLSGLGIRGYAGGGVVGTLESLGSGLWDLFTDPAKLIRRVVGGIVDSVPGVGIVRDMVVGGAHKLLDGLIGWVKHLGGSGSLGAANAFLRAQAGKPYGWAMAGPDAYDCSGIVSAVYNVLKGHAPFSHTFSTSNEAGFFPLPGVGGVLTAGWTNPGETGVGGGPNGVGHTAGVLAGFPFESTGSGGVHMGSGVTPLDAFAHIGHYARGGLVPGLPGAPQLAVVHGGERVLEQGNTDLTDLIRELIAAVRQVAPGVGDHISGVGRSTLRAARAR